MSTLRRRIPLGTVAYLGGVPAVLEEFCWSWGQMVQFNQENLEDRDHYIHYDRERMSIHDAARNALCDRERMLGDWILFLDTDHEFDPDLCVRMVRTMNDHRLRVLTAVYQYRGYPHAPVLFHRGDDVMVQLEEGIGPLPRFCPDCQTVEVTLLQERGQKGIDAGQLFYAGECPRCRQRWPWRAVQPQERPRRHVVDWSNEMDVFPIDSAGAGTLLVRRDALDAIRFECKVEPFTRDGVYGEDHCFFARLRKCGIQAYACPRIQSHHLRVKGLSLEEDYQRPGLAGAALQFEVEGLGARPGEREERSLTL